MEQDDDFPRIGRDFQKWSDLDYRVPKLDLDHELFLMHNIWIASFVILAGLLKGDRQQQQRLLSILKPAYFNPKSLPRYLFEKIASYLEVHEAVPEPVLEGWIPQYAIEVWGDSSQNERLLFGDQLKLRQILSFNPTEEQVNRAIELRKEKMDKYGYENSEEAPG
jgi:hypothetical protein